MVQEKEKYTVITGARSGIGYETAKAFAERGKNLIITARRKNNLEMLKREILEKHPDLDIVIRSTDLSVPENAHQLYEGLRDYEIDLQRFGISRNTTYKLIALEGFPKIRIGHKYFIPETKFESYIMCHNKSCIILK